MEENRKMYTVMVGTSKGKRPLRKPRRRWEDGIKVYLRERLAGEVRSGFSWLRIRTGCGFFCTR
jgi:hypothetical protein